jgi:hypothetical protein
MSGLAGCFALTRLFSSTPGNCLNLSQFFSGKLRPFLYQLAPLKRGQFSPVQVR